VKPREREDEPMTNLKNMTEDDWLERLKRVGVNKRDFEKHQKDLAKQFGLNPSLNDVVWRALNMAKVGNKLTDAQSDWVAFEEAFVLAIEGKDIANTYSIPMDIFLGPDQIADLRKLRAAGEFDVVERIILGALAVNPSPAALDELRKTLSTKASLASKAENWAVVVELLERYDSVADSKADECVKLVNQAPPKHTKKDLKLLEKAREKLSAES
jgi:hypothetical protein